jgi:hypothetical protein
MTASNRGAILNVCCPYTSREEITHSLREIVAAVENGELGVEDIDEGTIERNLYTKDCPRPDLLIRTSGVHRLSDFLLWQVTPSPLAQSRYFGWRLMGSVIKIRKSSLWTVIGLSLRFGGSLLCCWIIRLGFLERITLKRTRRRCEGHNIYRGA